MSVEIKCFHPVMVACLDFQDNSKMADKSVKEDRKKVCFSLHARWLCASAGLP